MSRTLEIRATVHRSVHEGGTKEYRTIEIATIATIATNGGVHVAVNAWGPFTHYEGILANHGHPKSDPGFSSSQRQRDVKRKRGYELWTTDVYNFKGNCEELRFGLMRLMPFAQADAALVLLTSLGLDESEAAQPRAVQPAVDRDLENPLWGSW